MVIIKDDTTIDYKSWCEVYSEIKRKKVCSPDISTKKLISSLKKIEAVSQKSFFTKPQIIYLSNLFNQIKYFEPTKQYSFISDLYLIGRLISVLEKNPKSKKLFKKGIFTNFGFFTQFLVSVWLNKYLNVVDFEVDNMPFNTDILVNEFNTDIHFHIKDISENEREERISDLCLYIDDYFIEKARLRRDDVHLAVIKVSGVPPKNLPHNYWLDIAIKIKEKPQHLKIVFHPSDGFGNAEEIVVTIQLNWRPFSGTFLIPLNSFNNSIRLACEYEDKNRQVLESKLNQIHILVAITEDRYSTRSLREFIKNQNIGIMTLEIFDFDFERSTLLLPSKNILEGRLNRKIPRAIYFEAK